jgi:hypothetical protein
VLLAEADRLAWLRVWTRAELLYGKAREAFLNVGGGTVIVNGIEYTQRAESLPPLEPGMQGMFLLYGWSAVRRKTL